MNAYEKDLDLAYRNTKNIDYSSFNGKTILFTGASGLIGKYFVDFIMFINKTYGYSINVIALDLGEEKAKEVFRKHLDNKCFRLVATDVTLPIDITGDINYIIHAASPANPYFFANYPVEVIKANILGTLNMLELSKTKSSSKMIFISSGEVYGAQHHDGNGFQEDQPGIVDSSLVRSCYTESKRCSETLVSSYAAEYNVNALAVRLCYIYGPTYSPSDTRVIFQFLNNYFDKKDIVMKSKGEQVRSYCYVSDAISGLFTLLLQGEKGEMYNLANPDSIVSIKEIAEEIVGNNPKLQIEYQIPDQNEASGFSLFTDAIQNPHKLIELGWKPCVSFKDGIKKTISARESEQ